MSDLPASVAAFLAGKRIAVAGVSRDPKGHVGNAILKKFAASGYETFAVNPNATEIEGATCYPAIGAIPGDIDGVVIATHPAMAATVVRQCADKGVRHVWFHRSFGQGSDRGAGCGEVRWHRNHRQRLSDDVPRAGRRRPQIHLPPAAVLRQSAAVI